MLANDILSIINTFNSKNILIGKTIIQKVLYLTFNEEHKNKFFVPYLYGPYSETVQQVVDSLVSSNNIYFRENRGLSLSEKINPQNLSFSSTYNNRFGKVLEFLFKNGITSTKDISNLAKINMLVHNNNGNSHDPDFLKGRARLLGWHELSKLENKKIKDILNLSDNFDQINN